VQGTNGPCRALARLLFQNLSERDQHCDDGRGFESDRHRAMRAAHRNCTGAKVATMLASQAMPGPAPVQQVEDRVSVMVVAVVLQSWRNALSDHGINPVRYPG
jgi:hypothetical protein